MSPPGTKLIASNRRARHDYSIVDTIEAGLQLLGSEVKSLRENTSNIAESYAAVEEGELWLVNSYIAPYAQAKTWGHEERRRCAGGAVGKAVSIAAWRVERGLDARAHRRLPHHRLRCLRPL